MARYGVIKRAIQTVPPGYDHELRRMSKADLAEIVWDLATRIIGDENAHTSILSEITRTNEILAHYRTVKKTKQ